LEDSETIEMVLKSLLDISHEGEEDEMLT